MQNIRNKNSWEIFLCKISILAEKASKKKKLFYDILLKFKVISLILKMRVFDIYYLQIFHVTFYCRRLAQKSLKLILKSWKPFHYTVSLYFVLNLYFSTLTKTILWVVLIGSFSPVFFHIRFYCRLSVIH